MDTNWTLFLAGDGGKWVRGIVAIVAFERVVHRCRVVSLGDLRKLFEAEASSHKGQDDATSTLAR